MDDRKEIKLKTKKNYSIFEKVFCLRCFGCMKADNNSLLTAINRKQVIQKMLAKNQYNLDNDPQKNIVDPLQLMILLFLSEDKHRPIVLLRYCRLNINLSLIQENRSDIEFYIPQLTNYIVFHEEFKNLELIDIMEAACRCDFYFAHQYYMYLNSLQKASGEQGIETFQPVRKYKEQLLNKLCQHYSDWMLDNQNMLNLSQEKAGILNMIKHYGTSNPVKQYLFVQAQDINLAYYPSLYFPQINYPVSSFKSAINFFKDLFEINVQMSGMKHIANDHKKQKLKQLLKLLNAQLPACVYIPFTRKFMRHYRILNIVDQETVMFNTKQRCLFSVSLQVYNPTQVLSQQQRTMFEIQQQGPITIYNCMPKYRHNSSIIFHQQPTAQTLVPLSSKQQKSRISNIKLRQKQKDRSKSKSNIEKSQYSENTFNTAIIPEKILSQKPTIQKIFGQSEEARKARIKRHSIFGQLKTWNMITIIIKTGDNLKQQQFALQLIQQFDYIFKKQKLGLLLTNYEVISMGPDFGIIQMVKDCVTIDKLYKKLIELQMQPTIANYFQKTFSDKQLDKVLNNFSKSLAAYSVVTYLLQLKDRHNGNIMLHRNGKLLHIDFGFFLSNAPGKGVGLQTSVPFKLNSQYIDALGGNKSKYFQKFRRYFFQGFCAARKHQDRILILIKMIYSSSGATMPCFEKGESTISQIENRFNPPGVTNEMQVSQFCQSLINQSLDNWKTKWYDKFQYWAQGILY